MVRSFGILAGVCAAALIGGTAHSQTVSIGANPQGSVGYAIGSAVAKVISEHSKLNARAIGYGGSSATLPRVDAGSLEMAAQDVISVLWARAGKGIFKGKPRPNIRVVTVLTPFRVGLMVGKDTGIKSIQGLKGQAFPTGFTSQRIISLMLGTWLQMAGMTVKDLKGVPTPNFARGIDYYKAGKVVGGAVAPGSAKVREGNAARPVHYISLPDTPKALEILQRRLPGTYLATVKPARHLAGVDAPTIMLGYDYLLVANAKVPDDVVYRAVKALSANKKALAAAARPLRGFDRNRMVAKNLAAIYHPGAIKFYKEAGLWGKK
ncbi:MAG TPA: TAXI family TRAP transporter solute-binding subunit [Alphaproteobacteria bacterium]|nr:TAXI family TRAP transporter solute-binding subunit [Alphaproteobacteria bacterium]